MRLLSLPHVLLILLSTALAAARPSPVAGPHPEITDRAMLVDRTPSPVEGRDIISSVVGAVEGADSYLSSILGTYPSYVASGVPVWYEDLPTGTAVQSSLGVSDSDLAAQPTQVLNFPSYANWTNNAWNLRFRGNVFKQPVIPESKLDDLANVFLVGTSIQQLPAAEQTQARNLTAEIFVVQQPNVDVAFNLQPVTSTTGVGPGGPQNISLVGQTTAEGDYDQFIPIANVSGPGGYLTCGDKAPAPQTMSVYTVGTLTGNATAYFIPPTGITVISDIDDILRITRIYQPADGLMNTFAKPFVPWMNMPDIYATWAKENPDFHFHYLTTTPEQASRNYMEFIYNTYPMGSFDDRPLNFSDVSATLSIRKYLLEKIFQTFPQRKFILVADTSNSDVMKDYPAMVSEFPNQVQCIFLRNTSATDSGDKFPYDTSGFEGLNQNQYMFFKVPDDLNGLDIVNGQCYNQSVPQNVTFKEQGLPFGLSNKARALEAPTL
ncbi:Phosphatidate phosphatase/4-nitrophenylphosphatase [Chlorociboria aeruginascens]|nr:Phosphatidate phosphatase/4-nitrophenylphosphatase [Chlorociboria aeruginascens]